MKKRLKEGLGPSFVGMLIWGSWAFYANSSFGYKAAALASLVQGFMTFLVTMSMAAMVFYFYEKFYSFLGRIILPPVVTISIVGFFVITGHVVAGTPAIATTVSPSLSLGFLYCSSYLIKIHFFEKE